MKKVFYAFLVIALFVALPLLAAEKKLGKGVSIKTATPVKALLTEPEKSLGKEVMIDGEMTKGLPDAGCWVTVKDASSSEPIERERDF